MDGFVVSVSCMGGVLAWFGHIHLDIWRALGHGQKGDMEKISNENGRL